MSAFLTGSSWKIPVLTPCIVPMMYERVDLSFDVEPPSCRIHCSMRSACWRVSVMCWRIRAAACGIWRSASFAWFSRTGMSPCSIAYASLSHEMSCSLAMTNTSCGPRGVKTVPVATKQSTSLLELAACQASGVVPRPGAAREQVADFVVGCLREVLVPEADCMERLRSDRADDVVDLRRQVPAGV